MASQIEQVKAENRARLAVQRAKTQKMQMTLLRKSMVLGTAAGLGTLARYGVPNTVGGFPWKVALALGATVGEATTKGAWQASFGGLSDSTIAIYTHNAVAQNTLIAGGGDYVDTVGVDTTDGGGEL